MSIYVVYERSATCLYGFVTENWRRKSVKVSAIFFDPIFPSTTFPTLTLIEGNERWKLILKGFIKGNPIKKTKSILNPCMANYIK